MNSRYNDGCAFPFTSASVHTIYFYCFAIYKEKRLLKRKKHNFKLNLIRHALKEIRLLSQKKTLISKVNDRPKLCDHGKIMANRTFQRIIYNHILRQRSGDGLLLHLWTALKYLQYSVENVELFCHSDFTWNQFWKFSLFKTGQNGSSPYL